MVIFQADDSNIIIIGSIARPAFESMEIFNANDAIQKPIKVFLSFATRTEINFNLFDRKFDFFLT